MTTRPEDLPDYETPPIDEVVIGVQFRRLQDFTQAHVGEVWSEVKEDYPRTEDQPPLFGSHLNPVLMTQLPFTFQPGGLFRVWLKSEDDTSILQIQNDRFLRNWRRREKAEYPRFEFLLAKFLEEFRRFDRLAGPCEIEQIEVTYINWLPEDNAVSFFLPAGMARFSSPEIGEKPEAFQWASRSPLVTETGERRGALSVTCNTAIRQTPLPPSEGMTLGLTFAAPVGNADELEGLLTLGRKLIVQSFTDLTTSEAQEKWGRFK